MSKVLSIVISVMMSLSTCISTDEFLAISWAVTHYPDCEIEFVHEYDFEVMESREGKNIVYIEVIESISDGNKYGVIDGQWIIAYNTEVPKGEKVTSYSIYNPYTNYCDDVVAVIDNGMIRS